MSRWLILWLLFPTIYAVYWTPRLVHDIQQGRVLPTIGRAVLVAVSLFATTLWVLDIARLWRLGARFGKGGLPIFRTRPDRTLLLEAKPFVPQGERMLVAVLAMERPLRFTRSSIVVTERRIMSLDLLPISFDAFRVAWQAPLDQVDVANVSGRRIDLDTPDGRRTIRITSRIGAAPLINAIRVSKSGSSPVV
jgi:hypothetical protein